MARLRKRYRKDESGRRVLQTFAAEFFDPERHPAQRRVSLGTRDETTAIHKLAELERAHARGDFDPWKQRSQRTGTTIDQAAKAFLRSRAGLSEATVEHYRSILDLFARSTPPNMVVAAIESRHVIAFLDAPRKRHGKAYKLSRSSRRTYVRHLRVFFRWCVDKGYMRDDPTPAEEANRKAARKTLPPFLHEDDLDQLIRTITADGIVNGYVHHGTDWLTNVLRFAVGTGLRRGEICNLRWNAVDLRHGFVNVKNIADDTDAADFETKTGEERAVPLVGDALAVVRSLHDARSSEADGYVFTGAKGDQLNGDFLSKRFRDYRKRAGLPPAIKFHSLRHTFASWWVLRGGDLFRLKEVLGHSAIETTLIYAHLRPDALREEAEKTFGAVGVQNKPADAAALQTKVEALELELASLRAKQPGL